MKYVLCFHKDTKKYLNLVDRYFRLKETPECPTMYLWEDISKFAIPNDGNGVTRWTVSTYSHVEKLLQVVETKLKEDNVRRKPKKKL